MRTCFRNTNTIQLYIKLFICLRAALRAFSEHVISNEIEQCEEYANDISATVYLCKLEAEVINEISKSIIHYNRYNLRYFQQTSYD